MKMKEMFPGGGGMWKAADLDGEAITLTIESIEMAKLGKEDDADVKPLMHFQGEPKGLVLNKTNAKLIAHAYGEDTDEWIGKPLELFPTIVEFQGRDVAAIRVRVPRLKPGQQAETPFFE